MTYDAVVTFSFSIPRQFGGKAQINLAKLLGKMEEAGVCLLSISGFASGRRFKIFCTSKNPAKLEAFLKSAKVQARKTEALRISAAKQLEAVAVLHKLALGYDGIEAFDVFGISSKSGGFVCSEKPG